MTEAALAIAGGTLTRRGGPTAIFLLASVAVFLGLVSVFWVGFLGSDDALYWQGANGWLTHFPYLGDSHWALRHTLVIPMALARAVMGDGLPALLAPSLLYAIGIVVVIALWMPRATDLAAAVAAMALVVTNPQFVLHSSVANVDAPEIFFVLSAFALIHAAMQRNPAPLGWLLLAGVSLGLAMVSRETSAFAILTLGLLFAAGYGMPRARYVPIAVGCSLVVGLEFAWVWWMSGNPFYRSTLSLHHDATTDRWIDQGASVPIVHPAIDPLTMLLLNRNFGLLVWIGVPLTVWLFRRGALAAASRGLAIIAVALASVWSFCAAALWGQLDLIPRYFLLPALLLSMLAGMALARLWRTGRRGRAAVLGAALIGVNLFSIWFDSRNYMMFGEHVLLEMAARTARPIHTDPQTLRRVELLLRWRGLADRVTDDPPAAGDLFFLDPSRTEAKAGADWQAIERDGPRPMVRQWLAEHLVPKRLLSPAQYTKLSHGHPDVTLYLVR